MKKVFIAGVLSVLVSSVQSKLPTICFDGTYAGGGECEIVIDGQKVEIGLTPDEFYQDTEDATEELSEIFKDFNDTLIQGKSAKQ